MPTTRSIHPRMIHSVLWGLSALSDSKCSLTSRSRLSHSSRKGIFNHRNFLPHRSLLAILSAYTPATGMSYFPDISRPALHIYNSSLFSLPRSSFSILRSTTRRSFPFVVVVVSTTPPLTWNLPDFQGSLFVWSSNPNRDQTVIQFPFLLSKSNTHCFQLASGKAVA